MLLDWINSFDIPSCVLVDDFDDLYSGVIISEILAKDMGQRVLPQTQINIENLQDAIWNWNIIARHIGSSHQGYEIIKDYNVLKDIVRTVAKYVSPELFGKERVNKTYNMAVSFNNQDKKSRNADAPVQQVSIKKRAQSVPRLKQTNQKTRLVNTTIKDNNTIRLFKWVIHKLALNKTTEDEYIIEGIQQGTLLCDLINSLEGRINVINGVMRNPKSSSIALQNINKALQFLRSYPKFNSDNLWSGCDIHDGNMETIISLLEHIYDFYAILKQRKPPKPVQQIKTATARQVRSNSVQRRKEILPKAPPVQELDIQQGIKWLQDLDFDNDLIDQFNLYLKNGVLLCKLINKLQVCKFRYFKEPMSKDQIVSNLEKVVFSLQKTSLNHKIMPIKKQILNLDSTALIYLFNLIRQQYQDIPIVNKKYENLPYNTAEIKQLSTSLLIWLQNINIIQRNVLKIQEALPDFRNGIIICKLAKQFYPHQCLVYNESPQNSASFLSNIRKGLELFKKDKNMSQKFTSKIQEVSKGDFPTIIGLLEDIHRLSDNLPPRKGENYWEDGPYLGQSTSSPSKYAQNQQMKVKQLHKNLNPQVRDQELYNWFDRIGLYYPKTLNFNSNHIEEFRSGELLIRIIEILERQQMQGIHPKAKTTAAALHNIRKVLEHLHKNSHFPGWLIYKDEDILRGNGQVIKELLYEIKRIYKFKIPL